MEELRGALHPGSGQVPKPLAGDAQGVGDATLPMVMLLPQQQPTSQLAQPKLIYDPATDSFYNYHLSEWLFQCLSPLPGTKRLVSTQEANPCQHGTLVPSSGIL